MKQIKINDTTKNQLDVLKDKNETYNNVVTRLIRENQDLKQDKQFLEEVIRKLLLSYVIRTGRDEIPNEDDLIMVLKSLLNQD